MPKGLHIIGNVFQGAGQGYARGTQIRNQTRAMDLREEQFAAQQAELERQIAEAEFIAQAEAEQFTEGARASRGRIEGGSRAQGGVPAQAGSGVPPLLERPAEDGVPPKLGPTDEEMAPGGAVGGYTDLMLRKDAEGNVLPPRPYPVGPLKDSGGAAEAFPVTQKALSGGSVIPQPMAQLAMEQAPEFRLTEDYLNRVESTIAKITDPRARELFIKRQWGILEKRAFDKEFGQMRSNFQRSVEMGEFHDVTEPGSDQFATNPEQVQGMLQVLDAIGNMAGVSGDPSDIRAARGALAQFFQRERELRGQYAQKRAAVQQKAAEKAAKIQVINQIAPMFPDVAARMWAELEGYDSRDLFPQDEFTGESQAGAFGGAMFGGAPQVGGPQQGGGQAVPAPGANDAGAIAYPDVEEEVAAADEFFAPGAGSKAKTRKEAGESARKKLGAVASAIADTGYEGQPFLAGPASALRAFNYIRTQAPGKARRLALEMASAIERLPASERAAFEGVLKVLKDPSSLQTEDRRAWYGEQKTPDVVQAAGFSLKQLEEAYAEEGKRFQ